MNLLLLRILPYDIERHGPAWNHTAFVFEGFNHEVVSDMNTLTNFETKVMDNWNNLSFFQSRFENNPILNEIKQNKRTYESKNFITIHGFKFAVKEGEFGKQNCSTGTIFCNNEEVIVQILSRATESNWIWVQKVTGGDKFTIEADEILRPVVQSYFAGRSESSGGLPTTKKIFIDVINVLDLS